MKKNLRLISFLLSLILVSACLFGCGEGSVPAQTTTQSETTEVTSEQTTAGEEEIEFVDYAAQVKLDMDSDTAKEEVTVKIFVDGDTTHFYVPSSVMSSGVLKARYLAINTPESTGKIHHCGI